MRSKDEKHGLPGTARRTDLLFFSTSCTFRPRNSQRIIVLNAKIEIPHTQRPTIADIARECGVSLSTVSRALSNHHSISEPRKQHIRQVAKTLGFEPRVSARTMRTSESMVLGCIVPSISHPFFSLIIEQLESICSQNGYQLIVANSAGLPQTEKFIVKQMLARQVDGVFFVPYGFDSSALQSCSDAIPTVVITQYSEKFASVGISHEDGGRQIAEHFKELGVSSCLFVGPKNDLKYLGFQSYIQAQKLSKFSLEILETSTWNKNIPENIELLIKKTYTAETIHAFDCIFVYSDLAALGVYHALSDFNCHIPDDILVAGFDDTPFSREIRPTLTSIAQPAKQIVFLSFNLLMDLKSGKSISKEECSILLMPHIVIRNSTLKNQR